MAGKRVQAPLVCHGHTRPIVDLSYSPVTPDGYFLTSASKDGQPMLRNGATGDWVGTFEGHKGAVWACVLNDPALLAATGAADFSAKVWDAITGDEKYSFAHNHIVRTVDFAHDCHRLVTGGHEKILRIFDVNRPEADPVVFPLSAAGIRCAAWCKQDQLILSSSGDKPNIDVWDPRTLTVVQTLPTESVVTSIEVSDDDRYITAANGNNVLFFDGTSLQLTKSVSLPYEVESASYSPEKQKFAAGGSDCWVHLHDYHTHQEIDVNKGHHGPVHCVRFAPGGDTYASGSEDGTIRIWQTDFRAKDDVNGVDNGHG